MCKLENVEKELQYSKDLVFIFYRHGIWIFSVGDIFFKIRNKTMIKCFLEKAEVFPRSIPHIPNEF